jgi:mono/diheme cytochrome c family protein
MHLSRFSSYPVYVALALLLVGGVVAVRLGAQAPAANVAPAVPTPRAFLDSYCVTCHNQKLKTAGLMLDTVDLSNPGAHAEVLEKVIGKLRAGSMPPPGMPRANEAAYHAVATALENEIDKAWAANPKTGRIGAVHRLNRS